MTSLSPRANDVSMHHGPQAPPAVVMNMFYTGLGIARSLGRVGVSVIGLSAKRGIYGNFTRFAKVRIAPDSRDQPQQLLHYLIEIGKEIGKRSVIFPTRDDDLVFLNRYRSELAPYYIPVMPPPDSLAACLDKWETYRCAHSAGIETPRCWRVETREDLEAILQAGVVFPCVLKPVSAHHWRQGRNWDHVGSRKAICITSAEQLRAEYTFIASVEPRALVQEVVPGGDDQLFIAACYLNSESRPVASFAVQKVVQIPEGFGTGCIVQTAEVPEIEKQANRLLQSMRFTGVAEVEFKRHSGSGRYLLIEVNPRPWDQHRLGGASGVDLIHLAYCEAAGIGDSVIRQAAVRCRWVAEDVLVMALLKSLRKRDGKARHLCRSAAGRRIYAIWDPRDPMPGVVRFVSMFAGMAQGIWRRAADAFSGRTTVKQLLKVTPAR